MECGTVRIVVQRFGAVDNRFVRDILKSINNCYNRIKAHTIEIVDLHFFSDSSAMNAFLREEKRRLGIQTSAFESSFIAIHDAWHGIPRIMIAYDKMVTLPKLVTIGSLHHEVAHTILHGSLEYYSFSVPTVLLKLEREGTISRQISGNLLYLASIAVKDYEVTRLLYNTGFVEDQVAYNKYFLKPTNADLEAWELAKNNNTVKLFVLVSLLKTVCCAAPLQNDERYGQEIVESISRSMSYLPSELSAHLLKVLEVASTFGENTHENVGLFIKKILDKFSGIIAIQQAS